MDLNHAMMRLHCRLNSKVPMTQDKIRETISAVDISLSLKSIDIVGKVGDTFSSRTGSLDNLLTCLLAS